MPNIVPLSESALAAADPNWAAMRYAIAQCERIDAVRELSDQALALRAYFTQSQDVENEVKAMRLRLRAERRLGELIVREQDAGRLATRGGNGSNQHRANVGGNDISSLSDLGIPRDRSARAQQLARVPESQFEAALSSDRPSSRSIASLAPRRDPDNAPPQRRAPSVDVTAVLQTWGDLRDLALRITEGRMLAPRGWTRHPGIQPFQIEAIRAALPVIVEYLTQLALEE